MALLSLLIVYIIVYHLHWGGHLNDSQWMKWWAEQAKSLCPQSYWSDWGGLILVVFAPVILLWLLYFNLDGGLGLLLQFLIALVVLFISLTREPLKETFEGYFYALKNDDAEGASLAFAEINKDDESREADELVRQVTRFICVESEKRYFGVIFWFLFLGPAAALGYRLCVWYSQQLTEQDTHFNLARKVCHWIDWLPARVSAFLFLLTGDFVAGFYRLQDYLYDADADNQQMLADTGVAALGLQMGVAERSIEENEQALSLVQRTFFIYMVLAALIAPFGFWP